MRRLSTYRYLLPFITAIGLYSQTSQPTPLLNIYTPGITATKVIDNQSSVVGQLTYVSIVCSGSSTWSVTLQYGSTSTGSFTTYDGYPTVTNSTTVPTAWGFLASYPNYIKVLINSGSPTCNFSGFRSFYPSASNGTITSVSAGTGIDVSGSISVTISNTGALSFNSRTGVISPTTGDYTATQVTNAFDLTANNALGAHNETFTDISTPANPSAGQTKIYSKSGKVCSLDSSGNENCVNTIIAGTGIGVSGATVSNTGALSFNIRTGAITPTTGDYTAAQVTNAFDKSTTNSIGANPITSTDVSTPANPSAGTTKLYSKSGKICSLSPAGIEFCTGSSSSSIQSCAVAYAASLVIDTSLTSSGSQCGLFTTTLTGNVTTFSITNGSLARGTFWQRISQDSTGGWTISGVAGDVIGMCPVDTGVSKDTWIQWEYNGTTFKEIYCTTNGTPTTLSVALGGTGATTFSAGLVRGNGTAALSGSELSGNAVTSGSNVVTVKGIQAGTSLPGTCTQGDLYFKTDAAAGSNIYDCTSTNTWTAQGGSSASAARIWYSAAGCNGSSGTLCNPSGHFDVSGGSGAANAIATGTSIFPYLAFDDSYTATISHVLTADATTITVNLWVYQSDGGPSGNWEIDFKAACVANGGSMAPTFGTMVPITQAVPANLVLSRWQAALTPSGTCSQGNHLLISAAHVADSGSGIGTKLYGIQVVEQ